MINYNATAAKVQLAANLEERGYSDAQIAIVTTLAIDPTNEEALRDFHADQELVDSVTEMITDASISERILDDRAVFCIARSLTAAIQSKQPDYEPVLPLFDPDPQAAQAKINEEIKAGFARSAARKEAWEKERVTIVKAFRKLDKQTAYKVAVNARANSMAQLAKAFKTIEDQRARKVDFITKYYELRNQLLAA